MLIQNRLIWPPEPGFFALALTRGGWKVPARISQDAGGRWYAEVNGEMLAAHPDPALAPMVAAIWQGSTRVDEAEYRWRNAVREHAKRSDPSHPALHPRKRINHMLLSPIMPVQPNV